MVSPECLAIIRILLTSMPAAANIRAPVTRGVYSEQPGSYVVLHRLPHGSPEGLKGIHDMDLVRVVAAFCREQ